MKIQEFDDYILVEELDDFEKGIEYGFNKTTSIEYLSLNERQNFEKNKVIAKIDLINKTIIKNVSNKFLIQTIGNDFSSLELTVTDSRSPNFNLEWLITPVLQFLYSLQYR